MQQALIAGAPRFSNSPSLHPALNLEMRLSTVPGVLLFVRLAQLKTWEHLQVALAEGHMFSCCDRRRRMLIDSRLFFEKLVNNY